MPRPRHDVQDAAEAVLFREELGTRIEALDLPAQRPVRLWVLDEMRHGLHGSARRVWGLPGHRPVVAGQQVYQRGHVYGAVALGLARSEFLLAETVDPAHLARFYRQIAESGPAAVHVLIQDGAGFHLPDGHEGLPYNPEPDPVEGLWDQLKDSLCNRVFPSLSEQRDRIVSWLQSWWADPRRVRSLFPDRLLLQSHHTGVLGWWV